MLELPRTGEMSESLMFNILWRHLPRKSFVSGLPLKMFPHKHPLWYNLFAHVLSKAKNRYPHFKLYFKNIVFLTPHEHFLYDQGTGAARIQYALEVEERSRGKSTVDWARLDILREDLKEEYAEAFPGNKGIMRGYKYSPDEVAKIILKKNKQYLFEISMKRN